MENEVGGIKTEKCRMLVRKCSVNGDGGDDDSG